MRTLSMRLPLQRALAVLSILFLLVALAACDSPEEKEARHLARGIEFAEAGDDAKAMVELRNVLRLNAKNAEALYEVGLIHERGERWSQAFSAFQAAAAERPGYIDANLSIGTLALMLNEVAIAEKAAADILAIHAGNPDAEVLDAAVMMRRGDLERAQITAEAVLAADPRHEKAMAVVLGVLQARGRTDEAVDRLDQTLTLLPDSINLRVLKIMLVEQAGDVDRARAVYDELVALEPGNIDHRLALSGFFDRQADLAAAETVLRDAIDRDLGTEELGQALARLVYRERGAAAAEAELQRLIERQPENNRFRFFLAELLTIEGRADEAEAVLAGIVDGSDKEAGHDAKAGIARLRLSADDRDGARGIVDEVLAENGDHRGANFVLGLVHLSADEPDEAIRSARTALRQDASWTPGLKLLAEAHLRNGENDLAISALGEVVNFDPADTAAAEMLAALLTQRGDIDTALSLWDRLVDSGQDPIRALEARTRIRLQQRNWTAAEGDINRLLETPGQEIGGTMLAGTLDLARNRYDESRGWFGKALELQPEAGGPVVGIVRSHVAQGDIDAALAFLDERTTAKPDDALAFQMKGELLTGQENLDAASEAFKAAIAIRPEWIGPYRQLAALKRDRLNDIEATIAVYEKALDALPDQAEILNDLGLTLFSAGRAVEALDIYRRLHELQPENDIAANNYAALVADYAYEDPEALEQALAVADRFRTSTNGRLLDTLGWLHYRKGDYPTAATYLQRAVTQLPDDLQFRYHLGMALQAAGQTERARLELERAVVEGADYDGLEEARAALASLEAEAAAAAGG